MLVVVGTYLSMLWVVSSAVSRRLGFVPFAIGVVALAVALAAFARGQRSLVHRLYFFMLLASATALAFEASLHVAPGVLTGAIANVSYTGYHWYRGGVYDLDPHLGAVLRPDVHREMYWQGHWWQHDTNADGYRGPAVARAEVVFLGDSMIYGHGVENDETVPAQYATLTGKSVANLGQQGTSLVQSLMLFEGKGLRLRPRLVFACSHFNDLEETARDYSSGELERFVREPGYRPRVRDAWQPRPAWDPIWLWARYVALPMRSAGIAGKLVRSWRDGTLELRGARVAPGRFLPSPAALHEPFAPLAPLATAEQRLAWQAHAHAVSEIKRLCDGLGARLVILDVGFPEAMSRAVEDMASQLAVPYNPAGRFILARALAGEEMYLRDDGHWTPLGCRAIAQELRHLD